MESIQCVDDFLSQYSSKNTSSSYRINLRQYFKLIYPELNNIDKKTIKQTIK